MYKLINVLFMLWLFDAYHLCMYVVWCCYVYCVVSYGWLCLRCMIGRWFVYGLCCVYVYDVVTLYLVGCVLVW